MSSTSNVSVKTVHDQEFAVAYAEVQIEHGLDLAEVTLKLRDGHSVCVRLWDDRNPVLTVNWTRPGERPEQIGEVCLDLDAGRFAESVA